MMDGFPHFPITHYSITPSSHYPITTFHRSFMSKPAKTVFACQECGAQSAKWLGRCADCGAWNSLVEERSTPDAAPAGDKRYSLAAAGGAQLYADIDTVVAERLSSGIGEFDRVLGGGVVPGSLVLIGGEP